MDKTRPGVSPDQTPALVLAYIGDAVYEIFVRQHLMESGITKVKELHREAVKFVNAGTQARVIHALDNQLTEAERTVVRRGRNAKSGSPPKNTPVIVYRYGTALEALFGYLYLKGEEKRLAEIFGLVKSIVKETGEGNNSNEGKTD